MGSKFSTQYIMLLVYTCETMNWCFVLKVELKGVHGYIPVVIVIGQL